MDLTLTGKTALVMGASQGIGRACAIELALLGATVIGVARRKEVLGQLAQELAGKTQRTHYYWVADTTQREDLALQLERVMADHAIDIVVNNTGGPAPGSVEMASEGQFAAAFDQHLQVNALLARQLIPGMRERRFGRIINILSTSVRTPIAHLGVSNTIRAAVAAWAKTLAGEVAKDGITVNSVLPGFIDTERLQVIVSKNAQQQHQTETTIREHMLSSIPAGRLGKTEEVGALVAFLASPAAAYITGTAIPVDGGRLPTI